jgi:hypothetical protein
LKLSCCCVLPHLPAAAERAAAEQEAQEAKAAAEAAAQEGECGTIIIIGLY